MEPNSEGLSMEGLIAHIESQEKRESSFSLEVSSSTQAKDSEGPSIDLSFAAKAIGGLFALGVTYSIGWFAGNSSAYNDIYQILNEIDDRFDASTFQRMSETDQLIMARNVIKANKQRVLIRARESRDFEKKLKQYLETICKNTNIVEHALEQL